MRSSQLLVSALSLVTVTNAWPWPPVLVERGMVAVDGLFRRQNEGNNGGNNNNNNNNGATRTATGTAASNTGATGTITTGPSGSLRATLAASNTTEFDQRDPAGGVSMITPNPISGSQFYKVGDWVTFAWNFTSLQATPTAVNVVASCTKNDHKYTVAGNISAAETQVLWDTKKYADSGEVPLLTEKYTLYVYDAEQPFTALPRAGYLGNQQALVFGMYTPQPYQGWGSGYQCPTCSGAASNMEKLTLKFLLATTVVTVMSFTFFANSFSIV